MNWGGVGQKSGSYFLFVCIFGKSGKVAGTGSDSSTCYSETHCKSGPCVLSTQFGNWTGCQISATSTFFQAKSAPVFSSKRVGIRDLVISLPFRSLHFDGDASYWSPLNTLQQMSDFYPVILLFGFLLDVMHFFVHLFVEVIPRLCAVLLSDNLGGVLQLFCSFPIRLAIRLRILS